MSRQRRQGAAPDRRCRSTVQARSSRDRETATGTCRNRDLGRNPRSSDARRSPARVNPGPAPALRLTADRRGAAARRRAGARDRAAKPAAPAVAAMPAPPASLNDKLLDAKVRLHRRLIEEINLSALEKLPEDEMRRRSTARRAIHRGRAAGAQRAGARRLRRRDPRRDDRPRPARAAAQGPDDQRHPDQRPRERLRRARRHARADARRASRTRRICCASSTRSSSAVGRRVDESQPMCDARLLDGSRVNVRGAADRRRRAAGLDPQILQEAVQPEQAGRDRRDHAADGRAAGGGRARRASPRSSRAAPAPARPRCSTRCRPSSPTTSA